MRQSDLGLLHRVWRLLPVDLRRRGLTRLGGVMAGKPDQFPPSTSDGIVVGGDFESESGLAETARHMATMMTQLGVGRGTLPLGLPGVVARSGTLPEPGAALLAVVNAHLLPVALARWPRSLIRSRRIIGMFAWELPTTPPSWDVGARFVHEIWAPSQFCVNAFERLAPGRVRLVPYPLAALPDLPVSGSRADFGIPDNVLVVLVVLNVASSLVRKNPEAAIAAFRAAFGDRGAVLLIVKLSGTGFYPSDRQIIISAIGSSPNIRVIDQNLPESALRGLIAIGDIILSLHRAEGFGLVPATAMLFGRAVVATGWSGNMDFMDADSAGLVDFTLVPVVDPRGVYTQKDCYWAEPDVSHAAQILRALADNFDRRGSLAMRGKAKALEVLGDAALRRALASSGIR